MRWLVNWLLAKDRPIQTDNYERWAHNALRCLDACIQYNNIIAVFWVFGVISFAYISFVCFFLLCASVCVCMCWELPFYSAVKMKKPAGEMRFTRHWYTDTHIHRVKFCIHEANQANIQIKNKNKKMRREKERFAFIAMQRIDCVVDLMMRCLPFQYKGNTYTYLMRCTVDVSVTEREGKRKRQM